MKTPIFNVLKFKVFEFIFDPCIQPINKYKQKTKIS